MIGNDPKAVTRQRFVIVLTSIFDRSSQQGEFEGIMAVCGYLVLS